MIEFFKNQLIWEFIMLSDKAKENKMKYDNKYKREHLKRIPLEVSFPFYENIKTSASASGESVNGYIKKAIQDRIDKDNNV